MLALGDALALVMSQMRQFGPRDFVKFHPGGSLGRQLTKVDEVMRPLAECRVACADLTVREVFTTLCRPGRRTGAIMLVDSEGKLEGIFTEDMQGCEKITLEQWRNRGALAKSLQAVVSLFQEQV